MQLNQQVGTVHLVEPPYSENPLITFILGLFRLTALKMFITGLFRLTALKMFISILFRLTLSKRLFRVYSG